MKGYGLKVTGYGLLVAGEPGKRLRVTGSWLRVNP